MNPKELKDFLDHKYISYNRLDFIEDDPILIPHQFKLKEDVEIAAFLSATIAWGQRKSIIKNATRLMELMDNSPYTFVTQSTTKDLKVFKKFVHRTFNGDDCIFFLQSLKNIYTKRGGLEQAFALNVNQEQTIYESILNFRSIFLSIPYPARITKHVANPAAKSTAKRLCMFLRWMLRKDNIDFGIWKNLKPSQLAMPLDVHTGNIGRQLGLLKRTQNDWQAVMELTEALRAFDKKDPIKYDIALFGLGVYKEL